MDGPFELQTHMFARFERIHQQDQSLNFNYLRSLTIDLIFYTGPIIALPIPAHIAHTAPQVFFSQAYKAYKLRIKLCAFMVSKISIVLENEFHRKEKLIDKSIVSWYT